MNERVANGRAKERETQISNENEENFDGVENREILVGKCVCVAHCTQHLNDFYQLISRITIHKVSHKLATDAIRSFRPNHCQRF